MFYFNRVLIKVIIRWEYKVYINESRLSSIENILHLEC